MGALSIALPIGTHNMKTLVVGLGNPILGDDGVGWKVAEEVKALLPSPHLRHPSPDGRGDGGEGIVEVDCLSLGGLSLMERMLGYDRVVLVDSMETGQSPVGSVQTFPLASLPNPMAGHSASVHDASLSTALKTAESLGAEIPKRVDVVAVEAQNVYDFSEELSPPVAAAVPRAVQAVLTLLQGAPYDLS
jgi:hydrogenase maturation protease